MEEGDFDEVRFGLSGAVLYRDEIESGRKAEDIDDACADGRIEGRELGRRSSTTASRSSSSAVVGRRRRLRRWRVEVEMGVASRGVGGRR